jgi:hypothetical protein
MPSSVAQRRVSVSAAVLLFALLSCTSAPPPAPPPAPTTPIQNPAQIIASLDRYASHPCDLLAEQDLADFRSVPSKLSIVEIDNKPQQCIWAVPEGPVLTWVSKPLVETGTGAELNWTVQRLEVAGYPATQLSNAQVCMLDVEVGPDHKFRTVLQEATGADCKRGALFPELVIRKLQQPS